MIVYYYYTFNTRQYDYCPPLKATGRVYLILIALPSLCSAGFHLGHLFNSDTTVFWNMTSFGADITFISPIYPSFFTTNDTTTLAFCSSYPFGYLRLSFIHIRKAVISYLPLNNGDLAFFGSTSTVSSI